MNCTFLALPSAILTALLILSAPPAHAQKEAEIVNKLRTALRDSGLDTPPPPVVGKGTFTLEGMNFGGMMYYSKPHSRMEMMFNGLTFIRVANDSIEWDYNPLEKRHRITTVPADYEKNIRRDKLLDFASRPLLDYKKLKNQLVYTGEQKIDSIQAYVLELSLKDRDFPHARFYINKRTNLIYKSIAGPQLRYYANYRHIDQYVYPSFFAYGDEDTQRMAMHLDDITVGKPIPASVFVIPAEAFASQKEFDRTLNRLLTKGDSLLEAGKSEAARDTFNEVIKLERTSYEAYNGRGLSQLNMKKHYEAIADFNIALEIRPQGGQAFNNRGLAKYYLGDNKGALADYTEALNIDSNFVVTYKNRALIRLQESNFEEAKADLIKSIQLRPEDADAHFKLGVAVAQLGQYEEALTSYMKAQALNLTTAEFYNYRGVAEYKLGKFTEAATSFREAIKKDADELQYMENLGNALFHAESFKEAEAVFEQYVKKDPKQAEMYNMIGLCKYRQEDFKGAIKLFTKAMELNDQTASYPENRAYAKEQVEDYAGAITDYTQAITLNPTNASLFYQRGLMKIHSSKKLEGCQDLSTAYDMKFEAAKDAIIKYCN